MSARYVLSSSFRLPNVPVSQQLSECLRIIEIQRKDLSPLKKESSQLKKQNTNLKKSIKTWQDKYQEMEDELKKSKAEINRLEKENHDRQEIIDKLTRTMIRYQVALFDHGNFKHRAETRERKPKGGQPCHSDTNRENQASFLISGGYDHFSRKRVYANSCGECGSKLARVNGFKQKVLLDIVLNPQIVKCILESERQWCSKCQREVNAKDSQSLPFTEYGLNTFMLVLILRFKGHLSMGSTAAVFQIACGLTLSKSDISNLLKAAANHLGPKYQELLVAARAGEVIYADETGWQVRGHPAWLWIMATEDTAAKSAVTVYFAAESRGQGIAKELYGDSTSPTMTDGLASYLKIISTDEHLYCWAHLLRFAYEETVNSSPDSQSRWLRDELVRIYHLKFIHPEYPREKLAEILSQELDKLLSLTSSEQSFLKIHHRLKQQKSGLIKALLITDSGTNNLAERELRGMVLNKKVSYGSDTYTGMEVSAKLGSVIQTLSRQRVDLLTELSLSLQIGIHQKYSQYHHLAYSDSS